ncbi:MAG TPA: hypothetical protein VM935_11035, partial [Chitinophagaceae bacterium]|nr:hypothetical protein [Chitinophagaceae bacterium]
MKRAATGTLFLISFQLAGFSGFSQSGVTAITTAYTSTTTPVTNYTATPASSSGTFTGCVGTNYSYRFNNGTSNALRLLNITANNKNYFLASGASTIKLRRVNNSNVTGNRNIIFLESNAPVSGCPTPAQFNFKSPYNDVMETFLNNNYINQGTDNIFTNSGNGDGNNNNIERVDVIFTSGIWSISAVDAGFALFDRGVNNNHDGFRIAAITSLNSSGDPASFGPLVTCTRGDGTTNGSWGHPTTANGNIDLSVYVMRKEVAEPRLKSSAAVTQQIGGVFFSFVDLGVANGQTIYGYSLIGPDGITNPTNAQLLNINNTAVYPTNTTETVGGGLDLIAINASFSTGAPTLPVSITTFSGNMCNQLAEFNWELEGVTGNSQLELEGSGDGINFSTATKILLPLKKVGAFGIQYRGDVSYYRLKLVNGDHISYSRVIHLRLPSISHFKIYPTQGNRNTQIVVEHFESDIASITLTSIDGRKYQYNHAAKGRSRITIPPDA